MIYFDHAATTPLDPVVRTAMLEAYDQLYGNPSALHTLGHRAKQAIEAARTQVATALGAQPSEIIFTSGSSEANNTVMRTFAGQKVLLSSIEHESLLKPAKQYTQAQFLPVTPDGHLQQFQIPADTQLLSVMAANNELGTLANLAQLAQQAHDRGALFHTDATQAFGKISLDVKQIGIDYLSISAHKIGAAAGVGALYVRQGAPLTPLILGGAQERGRRSGTYNTAGIVGFGVACELLGQRQTVQKYQTEVRALRDYLAAELLVRIPHASINHNLATSLPNLLNISFEAAEGESIQLYLDAKHQIVVSTGSACASASGQPSHVLMATRHDAEIAHSSIRISLGLDNTRAEVDYLLEVLPPIIDYLQQISTIKLKEITA